MADFTFAVRPRIWLGPDSLLRLPLLVGEYALAASPRALLIADPLLHEAKAVDRVRGLLEDRGVQVLLFDEVPSRATSRTADDALRLARGSRAPLVIAMGGIKTLMIARAVAACAPARLDIDALLDGRPLGVSPLPLIELPTSLRHGFMTDESLALVDGRDRRIRLVRAPGTGPAAVLIDPNLSLGLSPKMAAACVIDGLMGAIESYISARSSFMSDLLAERAVSLLAAALDALIARPDDPAARAEAWRGAFLAAVAQGLSAPGMGSALSLAVNARYDVPKSSLAAIFLPYSMEAAAKSRLEKVAALLPLLGREEGPLPSIEAAAKAVEWLRTRLGLLKIPSRLKDFDLSLDRLVEVARDARELDFMNYLPRAVSVDDVFDFVKTAY